MYFFYSDKYNSFLSCSQNSNTFLLIENLFSKALNISLISMFDYKKEISNKLELIKLLKILKKEIISRINNQNKDKKIISLYEEIIYDKKRILLNKRDEFDNLIYQLIIIENILNSCLIENSPFIIENAKKVPKIIIKKM